jgi:hypothetical protein
MTTICPENGSELPGHHFLIEKADYETNGSSSPAVCKLCGEERSYPNSIFGEFGGFPVGGSKKRGRTSDATRKAIEKAGNENLEEELNDI